MIRYFKGEPNQSVLLYKNGRLINHREGLDFWYMPFNTSIAIVNSDGVGTGYLSLNAGTTATIKVSDRKANQLYSHTLSTPEVTN